MIELSWQTSPYSILMVLSTVTSGYLSFYAYKLKGTPGVFAFSLLTAGVAILCIGKLGEIMLPDLAGKELSIKILMIGVDVSSLAWLMLGIQQIYRYRRTLNAVLYSGAALVTLDLLIIWTNDFHRLFWESTFIRTAGEFHVLGTDRGPLFMPHTLLDYAMVSAGSLMLLLKSYARSSLYLKQRVALMVAVFAPLSANIIFVFQLVDHPLDYTPLGYVLASLLLAYGYFKLHLVAVIPLAMDHIIENLPNPVLILDKDKRIRLLNNKARDLLGDSKGSFTGEVLERVLPEASPWKALGASDDNSTSMIDSNNAVYEARSTSVSDSKGQPIAQLFMLEDVTQRQTAEDAHQENLRFVRQFAEALPIALYELNAEEQIIYANRELVEMLGYERDSLRGKNLASLFLASPKTSTKNSTANNSNSNPDIMVTEETVLTKSGLEIPVINMVANLVDEAFSRVRRGVLIDITHRKRLEDAIQQSLDAARQANEIKSQFLANMSHEIRTPMNGVIGFAQLLSGTHLNENQRRYVNLILKSGNGLLQLINDILDLSRIEAGKMEMENQIFDPKECIEDVCSIFAQSAATKGLDFELDFQNELPAHLLGDANRIAQILNNVIGNAVKFTANGGVTVTVNSRKEPQNIFRLLIKIKDTGIGIKPDQISRLFDPFSQLDGSVTRKFGGSGLGLAITADLLKLMNGKIFADSLVSEGTLFTIEIPLESASDQVNEISHSQTTQEDKDERDRSTYRILLVEDHPVNRDVALGFLEKMGLQIEVAENGEEAIELASKKTYDLILMDIHMPGIDGLEATRQIRKQGASTESPIIGVTADVMAGQKEKCMAAGMSDHLAKPIVYASLKSIVDQYLTPESQNP